MDQEPNIDLAILITVVPALRADGVAYLNVKSQESRRAFLSAMGNYVDGGPPMVSDRPSVHRRSTNPSAEWRALADATCETCGGMGYVETLVPDGTGDMYCPDCRGTGKPTHTLTVECGYCRLICENLHNNYEQAAVEAGWSTQEQSRKPWSEMPEANQRTMMLAVSRTLHDCDDGSGSVDVVVAELVPVVDPDTASADPQRPVVVVYEGRKYPYYLERSRTPQYADDRITPLGPPLQPGDWVARLEMTT